MSNPPSLPQLIAWLRSITKAVHKPLIFSACMRILMLSLEILIFSIAAAGLYCVAIGELSLYKLVLALLACSLFKALSAYFEQFSGHYVAFKALELLRAHAFSQLWPKAPALLSHSRSGELLTSLTRDVDRIEVFYAHSFGPIVAAFIVPLLWLGFVSTMVSGRLAIIPALCVLLSLTVVPLAGWMQALRSSNQLLKERRELSHYLNDCVFGTDELVSYGRSEERLAGLAPYEQRIQSYSAKSSHGPALRASLNRLFSVVTLTSIVLVGLNLKLELSAVIFVAAGSLRLFEAPKGLEDAMGYLDHSFAAARRLWQLAHTPAQVLDGPRCEFEHPTRVPHIAWKQLSYHYRDAQGARSSFGLHDLNLDIAPGSHCIFMGRSGSGKSTAAQLLVRYDDPDSGSITLDGVDIREYELNTLRSCVVYLPQNYELLEMRIADNLRLGAPKAREEDLWEVLRVVELDEEIRALPEGLATVLKQDGGGLSGGQAQRLCLARALLLHPRVLVLDEFDASLNEELARSIRKKLQLRLAACGSTLIEIRHRLDLLDAEQQADLYLFDSGTIRAQGHKLADFASLID